MKNHEETKRSVFERIHAYEDQKRKKKRILFKTITPLCCLGIITTAIWGVMQLASPPSPPQGVSCTPEETVSEPSQQETELYAVIGSPFLNSPSRYDITELPEISAKLEDRVVSYVDPALENTQIPFYFFEGIDVPLKYKFTFRPKHQKNELRWYESEDGEQSYILDSQTEKVMRISFLEFPEGYEVRTDPITKAQARKECRSFVKSNFPDIDLSQLKYNADASHDYGEYGGYEFVYERYENGIKVDFLMFKIDDYGNIERFHRTSYTNGITPQYSDEEYIEAAKNRLETFFADKSDVAEVKNFQLGQKNVLFFSAIGCEAIHYSVSFTVVYTDGTEENLMHAFYLPYDENGKAISLAVEEEAATSS